MKAALLYFISHNVLSYFTPVMVLIAMEQWSYAPGDMYMHTVSDQSIGVRQWCYKCIYKMYCLYVYTSAGAAYIRCMISQCILKKKP